MDHIFFLQHENDVYSAEVTFIRHAHHQIYHVLFEDGYENIFYTDPETGKWIEEDLGETSLAAYFGTKVSLVTDTAIIPGKALTWCGAASDNKKVFFGFCTRLESSATIFDVYSDKHKFLYTLRMSHGEWLATSGYDVVAPGSYADLLTIIISICKDYSGAL